MTIKHASIMVLKLEILIRGGNLGMKSYNNYTSPLYGTNDSFRLWRRRQET